MMIIMIVMIMMMIMTISIIMSNLNPKTPGEGLTILNCSTVPKLLDSIRCPYPFHWAASCV